jgi:hypothetical protein
MKAILLIALATGATLLTGCETTVVEHHPGYYGRPYYGGSHVYYSGSRPYYYTGGVRYWGYPSGYSGYRSYGYRDYGHRDYDSRPRYSYSRNVEVERNTYVVNNNRTVYRTAGQNTRYHSGTVTRSTNVKVKGQPPGQAKKKKKKSNTSA